MRYRASVSGVLGGVMGRGRQAGAGFTLIEIMIVVLIIGILLAIAVPNFVRARESSRQKSCIGNLRQIELAKDSYLMDTRTPANYEFTADGSEIFGEGKYLKARVVCPANGQDYDLQNGMLYPLCTYSSAEFPHTFTGQ